MTNFIYKIIVCFVTLSGLWLAQASPQLSQRIVTLGGAITETVFALGAGSQVIARDMSSAFPKEAAALPDVGYFRTIGAEGVLAQNPTLILAALGTGPESQVQVLEKSGVQLVRIDSQPSVDATIAMITLVGGVLHREGAAAKVVAALKSKLGAAQQRAAAGVSTAGRAPRVVFLIGMGPAIVQAAGQGTAADALIALAGGENAFADVKNYKTVSSETLITVDPDVVLYGVNPAAPLHAIPDWVYQTRAGCAKRVYPLDLGYHLVFGPRLGDASIEVATMLYPETSSASASSSVVIKSETTGPQETVLRCPVTGKTL